MRTMNDAANLAPPKQAEPAPGTKPENDDLLDTILAAHGQLQALLARRGGRMPINVYMALCYLQAEITGRANPRSVDQLWPGGNNAKAV